MLSGPRNFRDLGGYRASGGFVRWGQVYRADSLHLLTDADHRLIEELGLRHVFDLRSDDERVHNPNPIASSVQLRIVGYGATMTDGIISFAGSGDGEELLRNLYIGMLEHSAHLFGQMFTTLAEDGVPAVFHCHAGKDRTGVAAALLLRALGVERDDVLDDYEMTLQFRPIENQHESVARLIERGLAPEAALGVMGTPRWAMVDTLDALDRDYGGVEDYLRGPCGMSAEAVQRLRYALVEPG